METKLEIEPRYVVSSFPTGSHTICNPPVMDTDIDTMILVTNLTHVEEDLWNAGWERSGREYPERVGADWASFKKGKLNYLVTDTVAYYNDFKTATELATKLNLLEKTQRITLFNYILADWEDEDNLPRQTPIEYPNVPVIPIPQVFQNPIRFSTISNPNT